MSPRTLTPFARLVKHIASALRTTAVISIPADILASIKDAAQPLDDTGLRDLVQLFSPSHQGNRSCLEAVTLSQLVQITFRLQPSLSQHNLIYSLLLPPVATGMDAYSSWQKSVSGRLVPTLLRLLEQGTLAEDLLVTAAHSLYLWIAGHEEAKRTVYSGQEALRRALGTLVTKRDNYVLRIVVANLIRELLANRLDRHLFWPQGTPGVSFNGFPLSRLGDAGWLARVVEFLSTVSTSKAFRTDLPEVYHVQYSESEPSVAIVSDDITILLPATSKQPLRFLQLPLVDGMVCQSRGVAENEVKVQYRPTTGYHISQGVRKAADELHLAFRDPAQSVAFAESVHSRVAKGVVDASPAVQPHSGTQKTSYAVVDLTQSSETSLETEKETDHLTSAPELGASISLPSRTDTQAALQTSGWQERVNGISPNLPQAQVSPLARHPPTHETPRVPQALDSIHKQKGGKDTRDQESDMSSLVAEESASEGTNNSRRLLKRPRPKDMGSGHSDDIDWDEDLRNDGVEIGKATSKKAKTTSTKAKTAKKATTAKNAQALLRGDEKKNKAPKSKAKGPSGKTAAATRKRRPAPPKSSKYVQEAQLDLEDNDVDQPSLDLPDSELPKHAPSVENEAHINDSQVQVGDKGVNSHEQDSIKTLPHAASNPSSPHSAQDRMSTVQEEAAKDSYPMDKAAKAGALAKDRTSFGMKIADALTTKAHLTVAVVEKQSRKSFGDVKKFVEAVNVTRNSSPPKKPAEESQDVRRKMRKAPTTKPASADGRLSDFEAQPSLAQVHMAEPFRHPPETGPDHTSTAGGRQAPGGTRAAHKGRPPIFTDTENLDQTPPAMVQPDHQEVNTSTKIREGNREEDEANGIPNEDLEMASVAVKHMSNQKKMITNINLHRDSDNENQVAKSNVGDDTPDPMLSRPAITATERSSGKRKSWKVLREIPKGANVETPMHPPPLPRGSERRSIPSPVNTASDDRERSLPMTDEHIQRKTPIVSFDARGPRNQGVVSPTKHPKLGDASVVVPPKMKAHAVAKRQKKLIKSGPIKLPEIAPIGVAVSGPRSEFIEIDEGTMGQEDTGLESGAVGETSDVNPGGEGIMADGERTVEQILAADAIPRENASQTSRVDENGSPRLHHTRKPKNFATNLSETPITAEQSETGASESEELEHSLYTEDSSSSPADNHPQPASIRVTLPPKAKLIHSRPSIGLQAVISEKFPDAPKVVNTAAFKNKASSTLAKPPMVIEKASMVIRKADNIPWPEASLVQADQVGMSFAAPAASPQPLLSDPSNHVTRLSPKVPANYSKALREASPMPASFKAGFKNIVMPPPPLPRVRHEQSESTGAATGQDMRKKGSAGEDEDLTLVNVEGPVGHERQVRPPTRRQREPSPDSSADSESSSTTEIVQLETEKRNEDQEVALPEPRMTQQNTSNVLNRAAAGVLLRLQAAEQAIQSKTQEYHAGCYATIGELETSHGALSSHEKTQVAPRVAALCVTYNTTIEYCSQGLQRVRSGVELWGFSEKIEERQNYLLSLMARQLHATDTS